MRRRLSNLLCATRDRRLFWEKLSNCRIGKGKTSRSLSTIASTTHLWTAPETLVLSVPKTTFGRPPKNRPNTGRKQGMIFKKPATPAPPALCFLPPPASVFGGYHQPFLHPCSFHLPSPPVASSSPSRLGSPHAYVWTRAPSRREPRRLPLVCNVRP